MIIDVLVPNTENTGVGAFSILGTSNGVANQVSSTQFTATGPGSPSGNPTLATYLNGVGVSPPVNTVPDNALSSFLTTTQAVIGTAATGAPDPRAGGPSGKREQPAQR